MNRASILVVLLSAILMLASGCSTNIKKIENNKQIGLKNNIKISQSKEKNVYTAYIGKNNKIGFLCYGDVENKCNYETENRNSYNSGTPIEERFWITRDGYYPNFPPNTKGVQCGTGSLWGWLAIFNSYEEPLFPALKYNAITNYNKRNPLVCNSRFSELDSTQIAPRLFFGLVTFFTPIVTGGTMHTREFDQEAFLDSIYASNIDTFKGELIEIARKYNISGGLDVIYLKDGDIINVLEEEYKSLLKDSSKKAGVIYIDNESGKLLAITVFDKYKNENLLTAISLQISDLINDVAKNNSLALNYDDISPYIPTEIPLPKIPAVPVLTKDEFEKRSNFRERVKNAVEKRESEIRSLQRKYSLDVFERNVYIDNLQRSFNHYLGDKIRDKNKLLGEIEDNIMGLSKVLFLENTSGYSANNFKYNAEEERLYFEIYSRSHGFKQEVLANIPPKEAKRIKLKNEFRIIPELMAENNEMRLLGFDIIDLTSNTSYKTKYTNINYKPETVRVSVVGSKDNIQAEVSNHFRKYKQKDAHIVDNAKKEIWYIDVAESINAKVPDWFSNPIHNQKIIGYGEGETLTEAKSNARSDLSFMVKVKVRTVFENTTNINDFKSFSEMKKSTKQSSNVELGSKNYRVLKQENIDGKWYVGLEYFS